jgi:hypothetical protein
MLIQECKELNYNKNNNKFLRIIKKMMKSSIIKLDRYNKKIRKFNIIKGNFK